MSAFLQLQPEMANGKRAEATNKERVNHLCTGEKFIFDNLKIYTIVLRRYTRKRTGIVFVFF